MGKLRPALAWGFLAILLACGEQSADLVPATALATAVERTIGAESFQVRLTLTDGGQRLVSHIEYVAPDRVRIRLHPRGETVSIAGETYYAAPKDPHRFIHVGTGCDNTLEVALPALGIVRDATEVRRNGSVYVFRSGDVATITGQARLENGYVSSLLLRYELPDVNRRMFEHYSFSRFGAEISIRRPDASSIAGTQKAAPNQGSPVPCPGGPPSTGIETG